MKTDESEPCKIVPQQVGVSILICNCIIYLNKQLRNFANILRFVEQGMAKYAKCQSDCRRQCYPFAM